MLSASNLDNFSIKLNGTPIEYHCGADWSWQPSRMPDFDFWTILEGTGTVHLNQENHSVGPGDTFVFQPGDEISASHDPRRPLVVLAFHFEPNCEIEFPSIPVSVRDLSWLRQLTSQLIASHRRVSEYRDVRIRQILRLLFTLYFDSIDGGSAVREDPGITKAIHSMEKQPDQNWTTESLAKLSGYSRSHFNRRFRDVVGQSPRKHLMQIRIQHACLFLEQTHMTLEEIASRLGYCDVYFFSRQFKNLTGQTPGHFRRHHFLHPSG